MLVVTSFLETENAIKLPDILCAQWGVKQGDAIYAALENKQISFTKQHEQPTAVLDIGINEYIILPYHLMGLLGFRPGIYLSLVLEADTLTMERCRVVPLHSPAANVARLHRKLEREFKTLENCPFGMQNHSMLQDIYMFLTLTAWGDSVVRGLLSTPSPLKDLLLAFQNDSAYYDFFTRKITELTLPYALRSAE